jgi:co-chaperonin GroES (HSP10)
MDIQPLHDIVLIKADPPPTRSKSGLLFVTEEWKSLPPRGEVMAVGPLVTKVKVGDRVLFGRYGTIILEDDMRLCIERHVHAKV